MISQVRVCEYLKKSKINLNIGRLLPETDRYRKKEKIPKKYGKINKFNNIKQQGIF